MAEGLCRELRGDVVLAASAGIETHGLNPDAVLVMAEAGIDISQQRSKTLDDLDGDEFDYVVTVCGHAHETCPYFPARTAVIHHGFDDPPALARESASREEALAHYRRVRDEIRDYILTLPGALSE
jgi:arsenate reductase